MLGPYTQKVGTQNSVRVNTWHAVSCPLSLWVAVQFCLAVVFQFCTLDSISSSSLYCCDNLLGLLINLLVLGIEPRALCFMLNTCFITE